MDARGLNVGGYVTIYMFTSLTSHEHDQKNYFFFKLVYLLFLLFVGELFLVSLIFEMSPHLFIYKLLCCKHINFLGKQCIVHAQTKL